MISIKGIMITSSVREWRILADANGCYPVEALKELPTDFRKHIIVEDGCTHYEMYRALSAAVTGRRIESLGTRVYYTPIMGMEDIEPDYMADEIHLLCREEIDRILCKTLMKDFIREFDTVHGPHIRGMALSQQDRLKNLYR